MNIIYSHILDRIINKQYKLQYCLTLSLQTMSLLVPIQFISKKFVSTETEGKRAGNCAHVRS